MQLNDVIRNQHGVISRRQAGELGLTRRQIDSRAQSGEWIRVHRGVYRHRAVPTSWLSDVVAAVLATNGVASHRCAAALWYLEIYDAPPPEVTVAGHSSARIPAVRVHWTSQWDRCDTTLRQGIPCTGIERTILDCAAVTSPARVERLAEAAIRKRLTSWASLATCLRRHARRGRNGSAPFRELLDARLGDPAVPLSDFSRLVANLLLDAGLPEPVVEHPVRDRHGIHILQVDLAWPSLRKAWELDGLRYHFGREDIERDRRKRNLVVAEGWTIQEILWSMYVDEPDELITMARRFLRRNDLL